MWPNFTTVIDWKWSSFIKVVHGIGFAQSDATNTLSTFYHAAYTTAALKQQHYKSVEIVEIIHA